MLLACFLLYWFSVLCVRIVVVGIRGQRDRDNFSKSLTISVIEKYQLIDSYFFIMQFPKFFPFFRILCEYGMWARTMSITHTHTLSMELLWPLWRTHCCGVERMSTACGPKMGFHSRCDMKRWRKLAVFVDGSSISWIWLHLFLPVDVSHSIDTIVDSIELFYRMRPTKTAQKSMRFRL